MGSSHRQLKCDPFGVLRRAALTYESTIMKHSLILARSGSRSRRKGPILTINSARQWKIAPWSPMKKGRMKGHSRVFLPAESAKVRRSTNTNQLRAKRHLIPKTPSGVTGYGATICTVRYIHISISITQLLYVNRLSAPLRKSPLPEKKISRIGI